MRSYYRPQGSAANYRSSVSVGSSIGSSPQRAGTT
nr:MAG TPA: hypothetical protein [Caudoviricetes sp.]